MSELEQFCLLAKTLKGRACAALIEKVLNHRKIFVFGELLSEPSVQSVSMKMFDAWITNALQLKGSENEKALTTLELYAFGTYQDYVNNTQLYLELTPNQTNRLKLVSLVTLANSSKVLLYYSRTLN